MEETNMTIEFWGALTFGVVIGWVSYRTLRRTKATGLGDIASVIGAVGGGAITALFPAGSGAFGAYGIGLALGFFSYLVVALIVARKTEGLSAANEWLGEPQGGAAGDAGRKAGATTTATQAPDIPPFPDD
jgi:hypothetical protein